MFKTKPRTLYKAAWVKVDGEEKCVIDSNALVAERIEEWENLRKANASALPSFDEEEGEGDEEFTSGIAGEEIDALFDDGEGASNIIKAGEPAGPSLEEIEAQAQAIIDTWRKASRACTLDICTSTTGAVTDRMASCKAMEVWV